VKKKYKQDYDIAPSITFDGDQLVLDIPAKGATVNGWDILPVHKAIVSP